MKKLLLLLLTFSMVQFSLTAQTTEFSDDFESGTAGWVLEGDWGLTETQSNSPSNSLTDSPNGNYAANIDISATLAVGIDMTSALDAELNLSAIYDIENGNFDYWYIEASGDGGATWVNVATIFGEGNLTPWVDYTYSLGGFVGNSDVKVRFRFTSDGGYEVDGVYIDDVSIVTSDVDNAAPLVLHAPPVFYESMPGDITLTTEIIDISGVATTTAFYSVDGGAEMSVAGVPVSGNNWEYIIPEQAIGSQVDYYVVATDASTNMNAVTTATFSYIAGQHVFYDNGITDFIFQVGEAAITGAAVRFSLFGDDIAYALIRTYTDQNNPSDPFEFHIWADENGLPGADLITPFMVTPESNLVETSLMTRIDLSAFSAELSNITGDVFMGYIATGTTILTQSTPGTGQRSYVFDNPTLTWIFNPGDDYHFRLVTSATIASDDCATATNINGLLGGGIGVAQTSPMFNNDDATVAATDPLDGFECFGEPDGGGATPSLENSQWFTFTGDGEIYSIITTDCNGTAADYIDFGDTQIAIYSGADCTNLTPVACNEDVAGVDPAGPYPAGLDFQTEDGVTYFMLVDGFAGSNGDYCIEFSQINNITCDDITLNDADVVSTMVCFGDTANITISGTVVPLNETSGFVWALFTEDVSGFDDPFADPSFFGTFGLQGGDYNLLFINNDAVPSGDTYYFVPIVFGGATDTIGDGTFGGLSFTDGCLITGNAIEVVFHADYDDLDVTSSSVNETVVGNGEASVTVADGSGEYSYLWSNGETTSTITGLIAETYMVTISDDSGCVDDVIETVVVESSVSAEDLIFSQSILLSPNPATDQTNINYNFAKAVELNMTMTNSIGQVVLERQINNATTGQIALDLQQYTNGVYFVKLNDGTHQAIRQLVVSK